MSGSSRREDPRRRKRQQILKDLHTKLIQFNEKLPPFGAKLGTVKAVTAADVCVTHRFINKFEEPVQSNREERRSRSIRDMLARDGSTTVTKHDSQRMARARLTHWFKGFRPSYRFVAPSGASARPFGDEHDIVAKLMDLNNWEVSPHCFDYAFNIVWHNHSLKRLVRQRFRDKLPYLWACQEIRNKLETTDGYKLFREQFRALVTFNAVVRMEVVPKDNENDRPITLVPLWDMICQLSFMRDLRAHARKSLGYDINSRADLHKTLIANQVCTIDLSAASDLVSYDLIKQIWPENVMKYLRQLRNEVVEFDGEFHHLSMYAPMGTGTTFDVMTFTLLSLLRFDKSASVFGDDIIIKQQNADEALEVLECAGLRVNLRKTFLTGKFRESCGGMYHDDVGYILSYDFKWPTTIMDEITLCNKLACIIAEKQVSFELEGLLLEAWCELVGTFPRVVFAGRDVKLSSSELWGLNAIKPKLWVAQALEVLWQRPITVHRKYSACSVKSKVIADDLLVYTMGLHRGFIEPVRKRTEIRHAQCEEWSNAPLRGVDLPVGFAHTVGAP